MIVGGLWLLVRRRGKGAARGAHLTRRMPDAAGALLSLVMAACLMAAVAKADLHGPDVVIHNTLSQRLLAELSR